MRRSLPWIVSSLALSACAATSLSTPVATAPVQSAAALAPAMGAFTLKLRVPDRQVAYVSTSTRAIRITDVTNGGSTVLYAGSIGTKDPQTGVYAIAVEATVGAHDFAIELFDATDLATAKLLAKGTTTATIEQNDDNVVPITLGGVVASTSVVVDTPLWYEEPAKPSAITAHVVARDAGNNVIIGTYASPVTLKLTGGTADFTAPTDMVAETSSETFTFAWSGVLLGSTVKLQGYLEGLLANKMSTRTVQVRAVKSVTVNVPQMLPIFMKGEAGDTRSATATVSYLDGYSDTEFDFSVQNSALSSVVQTGATGAFTVNPSAVGKAWLVATSRRKPQTVGYFKTRVANLTVSASSMDLHPYQDVTFTVTLDDPDPQATSMTFEWTADSLAGIFNPQVISVGDYVNPVPTHIDATNHFTVMRPFGSNPGQARTLSVRVNDFGDVNPQTFEMMAWDRTITPVFNPY